MRTLPVRQPAKWEIYALDLAVEGESDCPAIDFLTSLKQRSPDSCKELTLLLTIFAKNGPILDETRSKKLTDKIYELKSSKGDRILYFYDPSERKRIILISGFHKAPTKETQEKIQSADRLWKKYLREQ